MKTTLLSVLVMVLFTMATQQNRSTVKMQIFYTESYCMGMRPTEEIMAELAKPKIYPNKELIIMKKRGAKQISIATLKTNADGLINLNLPEGVYYIMDSSKNDFYNQIKNDSNNYVISSESCVNEWLNKPILTFRVAKKAINLKQTFNKSCYLGENISPCFSYIGPQKP